MGGLNGRNHMLAQVVVDVDVKVVEVVVQVAFDSFHPDTERVLLLVCAYMELR